MTGTPFTFADLRFQLSLGLSKGFLGGDRLGEEAHPEFGAQEIPTNVCYYSP
jgi:hypothetical protein